MHDIFGHGRGKIVAEGTGFRLSRIGCTVDGADLGNGIFAAEGEHHGRALGHVGFEFREERLFHVFGVETASISRGHLVHLHGADGEACSDVTVDNAPDEAGLYGIGLDHCECHFHSRYLLF